jgi:hypothetical protein
VFQSFLTILKKILAWTFVILALLFLVAIVSLWRYDLKERHWYNDKSGALPKQPPDTTTVVCILATVHQPNSNYNADSIVAILERFQPALILTEEDTLLFNNYHKGYNQTLEKPLFARLGRSFGFGNPEEIEGRAVCKYRISRPEVDIRPFDYEGRNAYYQKNNSFGNEAELGNMLERLADRHLLTSEQADIWNAFNRMNDSVNRISLQIPYAINQPDYYALTERRQFYQYRKLWEIINTHDSLKAYRGFFRSNADFWEIRNKKMAEHIVQFIGLYRKKRIIILTGSMHKYYLLNELAPLQEPLNFRLKEYYQ